MITLTESYIQVKYYFQLFFLKFFYTSSITFQVWELNTKKTRDQRFDEPVETSVEIKMETEDIFAIKEENIKKEIDDHANIRADPKIETDAKISPEKLGKKKKGVSFVSEDEAETV